MPLHLPTGSVARSPAILSCVCPPTPNGEVWTGTTVNHCARHRSIGPAEVSRVLEQRDHHQFDGGRVSSPLTLTSLPPYSDELQGGCLGRHVARSGARRLPQALAMFQSVAIFQAE